jgi:lipoyl(octanoyl) transferase
MTTNKIQIADWGLIPYSEAYEKQKALFNETVSQKTSQKETQNILVLCEHPHVVTLGKHGQFANLIFPETVLKEKQVAFFHIDRGGDVTYHGPGQLVGYPIFDLENFHIGLKEYIFRMEEAVIRLLSEYGIKGEHLAGASGVWIDTDKQGKDRKICAVGVKSSRYVTMHGFALNVNTDLTYFGLINPCGFKDKGVTSMEKELNEKVNMEEVKSRMVDAFRYFFD